MTPRRVTLHATKGEGTYPVGTRVYYGQRFSAAIFEHVQIVDLPKSHEDWLWIIEHLMPRLAPGATLQMPGAIK